MKNSVFLGLLLLLPSLVLAQNVKDDRSIGIKGVMSSFLEVDGYPLVASFTKDEYSNSTFVISNDLLFSFENINHNGKRNRSYIFHIEHVPSDSLGNNPTLNKNSLKVTQTGNGNSATVVQSN